MRFLIDGFAILLLPGRMSYAGYCLEKNRFLSNEEKIHEAVAYLIARQESFKEEQKAKSHSNYDADLDARVGEFLKENPTCCRIGPGDGFPEPMLWRRLSLMSDIVVIEGMPNSSNYRIQQLAVTNCGQVW